MTRCGIISFGAVLLLAIAGQTCRCASAATGSADAPDFKEVYDALRTHLPGVSESELNRAAVEGLIKALGSKVSLVTNSGSGKLEKPLVSKSSVLEGTIGYIRVENVADGLANGVRTAYNGLAATNKLKGVVLDLRYATGDDYAAAAATVDLFLKTDRPLLNSGNGVIRSKPKSDAISVPAAVLVNARTAAAAEALAAAMRETGVGLILGGRTAGQAMIAQEFPLKNGDRLRVATMPIELGDGSTIPSQGLKPDIVVEITAEDERGYYADAYRATADLTAGVGLLSNGQSASTNRAPRRLRFNEAELVRERREGLSEADLSGARDREPDRPLISDPALARALDLLKGLAVVRGSHS